jgi:hypothetical protein
MSYSTVCDVRSELKHGRECFVSDNSADDVFIEHTGLCRPNVVKIVCIKTLEVYVLMLKVGRVNQFQLANI